MKKTIYSTILLFFVLMNSVKAQDNLSFYNLGDYVIQTHNVSPIYLPKYKVSLGTPLNVGININSKIKLSDLLVDSGNNIKIDFNKLNAAAADANIIATNVVANIFMLGLKTNKGSITFFANAKSNLAWQFSKDFTTVAANGFDESFALTTEKLDFTSYNEIGIGITRTFLDDKLSIGLRLKSLFGIAHSSLEEGAQFSLDINPANFLWTLNATNATLNTSGISDIPNNMALFGNNNGFGMDLGLGYEINEKFSFELSINDLGSINWKNDVTNYNVLDVSNAVYSGVDFQNSEDVQDEIENALNDILGVTETQESFKSKIGSRTFFSAKYKMSEKNVFRATYFSNNNPYINIKPSFGLGYNRELNSATYGVVASTGGNNEGFRIGANLAVQLGFFQLYTALDDLSSLSNIGGKVQDSNTANFRFGINFLFGQLNKVKMDEIEKEELLEKNNG